ncbi:hypothetical protein [Teredinibacter haidensis]|uniref:hypothetical protein n=1 Tax=Teredinibacter haidensis TaxID=2731755 RepID=UPI00094904E9|nr:hypothetical protein [Teredinibacter haidensis]
MKLFKVIICYFAIAIMAGCSSNNIKSDYRLEGSSPKGVLMGSVTYSGMLSRYSILYSKIDSTQSGSVGAGSGSMFSIPDSKTSVSGFGAKGSVFALELEPGKYVFNGWSISSSFSVSKKESFAVEVLVEAGKAIYLGGFHFDQTKSAGLVVTGANVFYENQYKRDLPALKKAFPLVPDITTTNSVDEKTHISGGEVGGFEILLKAIGSSL